jgi:DNA polymerase-3 subunit alpha
MLRRAMGKKKPEEMAKQREIFTKGAVERGTDAKKAGEIFDLMAKFAEYGFNKSHSAAYAVLTYQTAYLKTYFPEEFMAALMTTEMSSTDKLAKYIRDARDHGVKVLTPDVNRSQKVFSVETVQSPSGSVKAIRFALEAIKGVGGAAVDALIEERTKAGPFKGFLDFCRRVSNRKANKKVLESLIVSGAFDSIAEANRPSLLASVESVLASTGDEQEERGLGQTSLFDSFTATEVKQTAGSGGVIFKQEKDWPMVKRLSQEKAVVGFYVSGHPLDGWQAIFEQSLGWTIAKLKSQAERLKAPAPGAGGGRVAVDPTPREAS